MVHLEDILSKLKLYEPYYLKIFLLLFITYIFHGAFGDNYVFLADDVVYRCKDDRFSNDSCASLINSTDVCTEWLYDNPRSFVAEFQLACQEWKRTLVGTAHHVGNMIGLLFVGPLSDRWGRRMLLVFTCVCGGVFGLTRSFVTSYWAYIVFEILEGALGDSSSASFMLAIEIVPKENRVLADIITVQGMTLGSIFLALSAWLLPDWRILLRVMYTPALLFLIYIFLVDESPRWLLSKGRKDEAIAIVQKIFNNSKSKVDKDILNNVTCEDNKGLNLVELLKQTFTSRTLLKRLFICIAWWTTNTFVGYGMSITSVYLQGSKYINYSLSVIVYTPAYIILYFLLQKYSRKFILVISFVLTALLLTIQPFVPTNLPWLSVLVFMIGRIISTMSFEITYIFTSELFPTYTRNSMHALCSSVGRIGSILAPQTPLLMVYWHGMPSILFGAMSLLAGLVTLLAPDTNNEELPDTVCQAEALGKKTITPAAEYYNDRVSMTVL